MKTNRIICVVAAIVLLAGLGQAKAAVLLYSNYGTVVVGGGDNVAVMNLYNYGSDDFTLSSAATVTGFHGSFMSDSTVAPTQNFEYMLGTVEGWLMGGPHASEFGASQFAAVTWTRETAWDGSGLVGWDADFTIQNWESLAAGKYWITIGSTGPGAVYWASTTGGTSEPTWEFNHYMNNTYGSAFSLTGDIVSGAVPEPAGLGLIGVALLALRKRRS